MHRLSSNLRRLDRHDALHDARPWPSCGSRCSSSEAWNRLRSKTLLREGVDAAGPALVLAAAGQVGPTVLPGWLNE